MEAVVSISCIFLLFLMCNGQNSTIVFSPSELINGKLINNTGSKLALRYGFHRTSECDNYEKAFICIHKCVGSGYDIAYADKYCFCTCFIKKDKAKYTPAQQLLTKNMWKLGAPKTTQPAWIQKLLTQKTHTELVHIFQKNETQPKTTTQQQDSTPVEHDSVSNETEYNDNSTGDSQNTTNAADKNAIISKATNGTDRLIANNAINAIDSEKKTNSTTDVTTVSDIEDKTNNSNVTVSPSATNETVSDVTGSPSATNVTDSEQGSVDKNVTMNSVKNETAAVNASGAGT